MRAAPVAGACHRPPSRRPHVSEHADGARGYPGRLTDEELNRNFSRARPIPQPGCGRSQLTAVRDIDHSERIGTVTSACARPRT